MTLVDTAQLVSAIGTFGAAAIAAYAAAQSRRSALAAEAATAQATLAYVHCRPSFKTIQIDWITEQGDVNDIAVALNTSVASFTIANNGPGAARDVWIEMSVCKEDLPFVMVGRQEALMGSKIKAYVGIDPNGDSQYTERSIEKLILTSAYHKIPVDFSRRFAWSVARSAPVQFGLGNSTDSVELPNEVMAAIAWLSLWKSPFNQDGSIGKLQKSAAATARLSVQANWMDLNEKRIYGEKSDYLIQRVVDNTDGPSPSNVRSQDFLQRTLEMAVDHPSVLSEGSDLAARVDWSELHQTLEIIQAPPTG